MSNPTSTTRLSPSTLASLPPDVKVPGYDRSSVGAGIVHLGIGAFHRAHQAWYTEKVLNEEGGDWAIIGASLRSAKVQNQLRPQNGLYTLVEKAGQQQSCQVIGAIQDVLVAGEESEKLLRLLADESIKLVTLTITEKGYYYQQSTAGLALEHAAITGDIEIVRDRSGTEYPRTAIGILVAALRLRQQQCRPGLTLLSCDNLPHNGGVLRRVILDFAGRVEATLADWIDANVSFPSSMVDRIVPATTDENLQQLEQHLGLSDCAAVFTEPFSQWVVEDKFTRGRPRWECAGALFVNDVTPFEDAKLRLLNGSHSLIAYLGFLSGFDFVHQVVADNRFLQLVRLYMSEVVPGLQVPESFDLDLYREQLLARFANSALNHRTAQIAEDGSQKVKQRWFNSIANKRCVELQIHALALAGWIKFLGQTRDSGATYTVVDPLAAELTSLVKRSQGDETAAIANVLKHIGLGSIAEGQSRFMRLVTGFYQQMNTRGVGDTVTNFINRANA